MTYTFSIYDTNKILVGVEQVTPSEYMGIFGTETPTEEDLREAGLQLLRYYRGREWRVERA